MTAKEQIKVLVIPSWYPPKGGYFFREHAIALAAAGIKVDVLAGLHTSLRTLTPKILLKACQTSTRSFEGITEHTKKYWIIPFSDKPNFHGWVSMMLRFYQNYQKKHGPPHVILAHSSIWAGLVAAFIREKHGIPYVIAEHRSRFIYNTAEAKSMFKPWFFNYLKMAFEGAEKVVTVSDALQPFIRQIAPGAEQHLVSIPNMVDTEFFYPARRPESLSPFVFFSLANLIPLKGMDTLIEAMALLQQEAPGAFSLIIGGHGPERERLEKLVSQRALKGVVEFTGRLSREEIRLHMQQSHAFALASHFEAFGVVYIEAMACGKPVIASRAGGPESFIRESEGILAQAGNAHDFAQAMKTMKENFKQFNQESIRNHAVTTFGRENVAQQYVKIFNEIVK